MNPNGGIETHEKKFVIDVTKQGENGNPFKVEEEK